MVPREFLCQFAKEFFTNNSQKRRNSAMHKVAIRTSSGHYLTAVKGGGMGEAANVLPIHTDAGKVGGWEQFKVHFQPDGHCTIQTQSGYYLTAVGGGGVGEPANTHPVHTDQKEIGPNEKFTLVELGKGVYAFQTEKGTYLSAVGGGGKGEAANKLPLHTDTKKAGGWEHFIIVPVKGDHSKKKKHSSGHGRHE
jgi:hypothetical protein